MSALPQECIFCRPQREILCENAQAIAVFDSYPVSPGHSLILPRRHAVTVWDLSNPASPVGSTKLMERLRNTNPLSWLTWVRNMSSLPLTSTLW